MAHGSSSAESAIVAKRKPEKATKSKTRSIPCKHHDYDCDCAEIIEMQYKVAALIMWTRVGRDTSPNPTDAVALESFLRRFDNMKKEQDSPPEEQLIFSLEM